MTVSRHLAFVLCLAVLCLQTPAAAQNSQELNQAPAGRPGVRLTGADFWVLNQTQVPVTSVEVSRPEETNWGVNRLGTATLAPGARFLVELPKDGKCSYDLRVKFRGGNVFEQRTIDTCKISEYRLNVAGSPPAAPAAAGAAAAASGPVRVTFINAFRRPLTELRVSLSASPLIVTVPAVHRFTLSISWSLARSKRACKSYSHP